MLWQSQVHILTWRPTILTENVLGFPRDNAMQQAATTIIHIILTCIIIPLYITLNQEYSSNLQYTSKI